MNATLHPTAGEQMRNDTVACGSVLVTLLAGAVSVLVLLF